MRAVVDAVVDALDHDGFEPAGEAEGFVDLHARDDDALRVIQLQVMPPTALRRRRRLVRFGDPMVTANLQVDHVRSATTFGRPLGTWPWPVDERIGLVASGSDTWWLLGAPSDHADWPHDTDPDALAADLVATLRSHGLPFLAAAADPTHAHERGLARHDDHAAELAWLAGDHAAAVRHLEEVRRMVATWDDDPPTPDQQRVLQALGRLERVVAAS